MWGAIRKNGDATTFGPNDVRGLKKRAKTIGEHLAEHDRALGYPEVFDIVEDISHQLCHWLEDLKKIGAINPEEASNIFHRMLVRMMFCAAGKQGSSF